ncbi:MAG: Major facilitator superfamily 1 [Verrucomicrobiales bacterium]|nr:Major facilitator superfamily 1 [Verrucomicrobiales bacterium]
MTVSHSHKIRTLWLAGILHAFTHIYHVALMPLYLQIQEGLHLESVGKSTLLMTVLMISYFGPSYPAGLLADHFSRKKLLATGLAINGLGFVGLGFANSYPMALACMVLAGVGGSLFHPAATAMVARLFPVNTGKALGLLGIGASVGFFIGPLYSGWRGAMAGYRSAVIELGAAGMIFAIIFYLLANEEAPLPHHEQQQAKPKEKIFPTPALWAFFLAACVAFGLRDFSGMSMGSLGSLFLQRAHGFDVRQTGFVLSFIYIASAVSNPLFGHLSDKARLRWCFVVMSISAFLIALFPHVPRNMIIPTFMAYGFFFLASYPIIETAVVVSVPERVRGRVFGMWLTIGGALGNLSHWLIGKWVQRLGPAADSPAGYFNTYIAIACLLLVAMIGLPCMHLIRKREGLEGIEPPETPEARPMPETAPGQ